MNITPTTTTTTTSSDILVLMNAEWEALRVYDAAKEDGYANGWTAERKAARDSARAVWKAATKAAAASLT